MSVRVGDRKEGKLPSLNLSKEMIEYTYDRVHDKTLPKTDRWLMTKTIWDDASKARACIIRANAIRVENTEEAQERILLVKLAIGHLDSLISSIDILHIKGVISDDRADFWTGIVARTQIATKAMLKSDKKAYAEYLHG